MGKSRKDANTLPASDWVISQFAELVFRGYNVYDDFHDDNFWPLTLILYAELFERLGRQCGATLSLSQQERLAEEVGRIARDAQKRSAALAKIVKRCRGEMTFPPENAAAHAAFMKKTRGFIRPASIKEKRVRTA